MKKLLIVLLLLTTPALATPRFVHLSTRMDSYQVIYAIKQNQPVIYIVPKCTDKLTDNCAWNKTTAKEFALKKAEQEEKK